MGLGASGSLVTASSSQLIGTDIGGAGHGLTGTTLVAGHHTAHTGLDAGHGSGRGPDTHRGALTDGLHSGGAAVLAGLLETGVRGAGDGLAAAGLIAGDALGTTGAGTAHHLIAVGDAEADLGGFRLGLAAAEGIHLLGADVLIAGDAVAGAELVSSDGRGASDHGAGHTGAGEGFRQAHLGGGATFGQRIGTEILVSGEAALGAGFIAGDAGGTAHHHTADGATLLGEAVTHLAGGDVATTAVGSALLGGDVFRARHGLAGAGLITGDLAGTTHFVTGDAVAVAGGGDAHLVGGGGLWSLLTEGLEHFRAEVLGPGDGAAGAGLVAGGLHRAVGLGAGHGLTVACGAFTHLPVGIGGSSLLGTVAVGAGRASHTTTLLVAGAGLGAQFTHLLGQLTAGEIRIGLTGNSGCTGGLLAGGLAMLRHGFTAGQHQGAAGVLDGAALGSTAAAIGTPRKLGSRSAQLNLLSGTLATAAAGLLLFDGGGNRCGGLSLTGDISAVAIAAGVGGLAATGQGFTASQHQIPAGMTLGLHLGGAAGGCGGEADRPLRSCSNWRGCHHGRRRLIAVGVGAGLAGIGSGAHTIGRASCSRRGLLARCGQRLAAFECEFATGKSCHVRPRMST